nr:helix-turn-helix transcriptional regulator [uncultured Blautia sp.]
MTVGDRIRKHAIDKGMNLKQVATKAGISYSTLYAIVKRKSDGVRPDLIESIATALQISPSELYWDNPVKSHDEFLLRNKELILKLKNGKLKDIINGTIDIDADEAGRLLERFELTGVLDASDESFNFVKNYLELGENFQADIEKIVVAYISMGNIGRKKMVEYAQDLAKIQEYQNK